MLEDEHATPTKILAIDPSSTCTGYAVMYGIDIVDAGHIKAGDSLPAVDRVAVMTTELVDLITQHEPTMIIMEIPSGKVARRLGGIGAGLSIYGFAAGAMWQAARSAQPPGRGLITVNENEWTRGVPKRRRRAAISELYPEYRKHMHQDKGGDVSDAIGLVLWYLAIKQNKRAIDMGCRQ